MYASRSDTTLDLNCAGGDEMGRPETPEAETHALHALVHDLCYATETQNCSFGLVASTYLVGTSVVGQRRSGHEFAEHLSFIVHT